MGRGGEVLGQIKSRSRIFYCAASSFRVQFRGQAGRLPLCVLRDTPRQRSDGGLSPCSSERLTCREGWDDGWAEGCREGTVDGCCDGWVLGSLDGCPEGWVDGCPLGRCVGWIVGWVDGWVDGWAEGSLEGCTDGCREGCPEGRPTGWVGVGVGRGRRGEGGG